MRAPQTRHIPAGVRTTATTLPVRKEDFRQQESQDEEPLDKPSTTHTGGVATDLRHHTGTLRFTLNFNPAIPEYWSAFAEDTLFGAHHDAYSSRMTAFGYMNPEYEEDELEKAL